MLAGFTFRVLKHPFSIIAETKNEQLVLIRSAFGELSSLTSYFPIELKRYQHQPELEQAITAYHDKQFDLIHKIKRKQFGPEFTLKVWKEIARVKPGKTISYAQLADKCGHPGAVRAVGTACGRNSLPIFVPCHRILPSSGKVGNYAYGSEVKEQLLWHENDKHHTLK